MNSFSSLIEKKNMPMLLLSILFIIYLVMDFRMPSEVAMIVDSSVGKVVVALVALFLFAYSNPILGVLGLIVAYKLVTSASVKTGMASLQQFYPTEQKKWSPFTSTNQFSYTLEQEVVKQMAPQKFNVNYVKAPWSPVLSNTYDASSVTNI